MFNLDASGTYHQFDHFVVPNASLPPSFHGKLMRDAAQWLDVYQERDTQVVLNYWKWSVLMMSLCHGSFKFSGTYPFVRYSRAAWLNDQKYICPRRKPLLEVKSNNLQAGNNASASA